MAEHIRKVSAGSRALDAALNEHGSRKDLAEKLGRGQELVSRWASGWRTPVPPDRKRLEAEFGIPWDAWDDFAPEEAPADAAPTFQHPPSATGTDGVG